MITYDKLQYILDAYNDFRIDKWEDVIKVKEFLSLEENKDLTVDQALIKLGMEEEGDAPWYSVVKDLVNSGKYNLNDASCVDRITDKVMEYINNFSSKIVGKRSISRELVKEFVETTLLFKYV